MSHFKKCINVIKNGGIILYPTDTIYGLGCDAHNMNAIKRINVLKGSNPKKPLIYLMRDLDMIKKYIKNIPDFAIDFLLQKTPTTLIFKNLKSQKLSTKSIALRIPKNKLCLDIISGFNNPITSTSANLTGSPYPKNRYELDKEIINQVDYYVKTDEFNMLNPSTIIEIKDDKNFEIIR